MADISDEDLIAERRDDDRRRYLINMLNDDNAPRLAPAIRASRRRLAEGEWCTWSAVLAAGLRESDVSVKTIDSVIRQAILVGFVARRGEYERWYDRKSHQWTAKDSRELRLVDWPESL